MASKRTSNTVSAVERIEVQIAELEATKRVVEFIESQIDWINENIGIYQSQIDDDEAAGETISEHDYRRNHIKDYYRQRTAMYAVMDKLTD